MSLDDFSDDSADNDGEKGKDVQRRLRKLVLKIHPDVIIGAGGAPDETLHATELITLVNVLSDSKQLYQWPEDDNELDEYGEKGEKHHLNLKESDLKYKELLKALKDFKVNGVAISESPNIEEDALLMKKEYVK